MDGGTGVHLMRLARGLRRGWIGRFAWCAYSFTLAFVEVYDGHTPRDFSFVWDMLPGVSSWIRRGSRVSYACC